MNKIGGLEEAFELDTDDSTDIETKDIKRIIGLQEELCEAIKSISDSDPKLTAKAISSISHQLGKVTGNILSRRREKAGSRIKQQERFQMIAMPDGKPQERVIGLFDILVEWGPDWLEWMRDNISPWETAHRFITMKKGKGG